MEKSTLWIRKIYQRQLDCGVLDVIEYQVMQVYYSYVHLLEESFYVHIWDIGGGISITIRGGFIYKGSLFKL